MAYSNAAAIFRADLSGHVFETQDWEKGLIADKVAPPVSVDADSGLYPVIKKTQGQLLKRDVKNRAAGGGYPRGTWAWEQDTYSTLDYGHEQVIDDKLAARMKRFLDVEIVTAAIARRKVLLDQEIRVAALTFNTTNYGSATNSGTAYTEANLATFDAALDVDKIKDSLVSKGERPNAAVIPYQVWTRIKASTKFQNRARGLGFSSDAILRITPEMASEILELDNVFVPQCAYDSAGENLTFSSSLIWANTYIWVGRVVPVGNVAGIMMGGSQYQLAFSEYGTHLAISTYRDEANVSDVVRAAQDQTEKCVNGASGELLATQYS